MQHKKHCQCKNKLFSELSEHEWVLIWMAMRYCLGRQSISAATFPSMIVSFYYKRMTSKQRYMLAKDIEWYLNNNETIGNKNIDHPIWLRFYNALKFDSIHYDVTVKENGEEKIISCFQADDLFYPLEEYLNNPELKCYIPKELIVDVKTVIVDGEQL